MMKDFIRSETRTCQSSKKPVHDSLTYSSIDIAMMQTSINIVLHINFMCAFIDDTYNNKIFHYFWIIMYLDIT